MKIIDLKTNHIKNPLGFHMENARLEWKVTGARGRKTEKACVRVLSGEKMQETLLTKETREHFLVIPCDVLKPSTRYFWNVSVSDDTGDSAVSETVWFETPKAEHTWAARWITPKDSSDRVLEKTFQVQGDIQSALLSISAVGLYEACLNGQKIGDEYLTPNFNDYDTAIQFQTYHVENLLRKGENTLRIMMGNGWYKGRIISFGGKDRDRYGSSCAAIAELNIRQADGKQQLIATGADWKSGKSPILRDGIYDGEVLDDTVPEAAEGSVRILEGKPGKLTARRSLPVRRKMEIAPVQILHSKKGETILDFGQNLAGWPVFFNRLPKGAKCRLTAAEILQDGCFYHENMRTAKTVFTYISDGNEKWVRPHFTYFGFRYLLAEGFGENVKPEDFKAVVLYSDMDETGSVTTDHPLVNRLMQNVVWGQRSNFIDVPTDCPQRDERLGWTGDTQIFAGTASFNMDTAAFFRKHMWDVQNEQRKNGGKVPLIVPNVCLGGQTSAAWGDVACIVPWTLYEMYGDREMLAEMYPGMKAWVQYVHGRDIASGGRHLWDLDYHFGDWLSLDAKEGAATGGTDQTLIATAFYYYSTKLLAKAAKALDLKEDAKNAQNLAEKIRESFQRTFISPEGHLCSDTQTAHALVLFMDLYRNQKEAEKLSDRLEELILENHGFLSTGFVGTPYLLPALARFGKGGLAYHLLLNEEYPGWLYAVKLGATTIWERWNSVLPDGTMNPEGMNSLNHYAYGSVMEWVYRYAAGLNPLLPGWKHFRLCPHPDRRLGSLRTAFDSPYGKIVSNWNFAEDDTVRYHLEVPFDTEAGLILPGKEAVILLPGKYDYVLPAPRAKKGYSGNTKVSTLLSDPDAAELIRQTAPGLAAMPAFMQEGSIKSMMQNVFSGYTTRQYRKLEQALAAL